MTRLQRRHFNSTPSGRNRASKLPHKHRLSRAERRRGVCDWLFILMKLKIIFNFICQGSGVSPRKEARL